MKGKTGPKPKLNHAALVALLREHNGNITAAAAAAGVAASTLHRTIIREAAYAELDAAREGTKSASEMVADELVSVRAMLGDRLTNGERVAADAWLFFLRGLRAMRALPAEMPLEPGVAVALRRGDVTPDEVVAAYGPAGAEAAWAALHGVVVDELRAALAARADDGAVLTDFCGVLHRAGIDVAALLPAHLRRRGGRPAFKQVKP